RRAGSPPRLASPTSRLARGSPAAASRRGPSRGRLDLRAVPGDGALEAVTQACPGAQAEEGLGLRGVEPPSRLPVRLRPVPAALPGEAGEIGYESREIPNRDLFARPQVHGLGSVVALRGEHEAVDTIVDVQELARWRAVAPEGDLVRRLEHLPDQRRNHVRRAEVRVSIRAV